ncbi:Pleckstrin homology domain-containing protein [Fomitopsis serialis]|uniref:Pleckstrin homology domain-containing protein n=1 Tax=Fomitopsis serialis TaxID=139415 RepID=UPI0020078E7B|nr:Pleckstrin homology domain-containing protein [Neoantrodia serialis]KAH9936321.1 Pleckstrin homology domain-containing protein [Neoantrodia serialis]
MYRRWRQSEWGRALRQRKDASADRHWVGTSFDVGVFLGVDTLDKTSRVGAESSTSIVAATSKHASAPASTGTETFVTAPQSNTAGNGQALDSVSTPAQRSKLEQASHRPAVPSEDDRQSAADSSTALLSSTSPGPSRSTNAHTEHPTSPNVPGDIQQLPSMTDTHKGKGKMHVHYSDPEPAPPSEVLTRTGEAVENTSAGAAQQADPTTHVAWGDVILRDRMLIKFSHIEAEALPSNFDEWHNRTTGHLYNEDWKDYIVVWRKDRLELYKSHNMPGKDWMLGHPKLVFIVPLDASTTRLSLYSFVDLTFCIVCAPAPLKHRSKRRWLYGSRKGLNIFIFKLRSRSRATDWLWYLWRHMGNALPDFLEVLSPTLETRIKIDMPGSEGKDVAGVYAVFSPNNVLQLCQEHLMKMPEYQGLLGARLAAGEELALAWRSGMNLDWVWQLEDVRGHPRKWAVLAGLALNQQGGKPAHLEVRLKDHLPTRLHLGDGTRLDEPPAVEGYVERIRPNSQLRQPLYLTTHDGYLFTLLPAHAHHPPPPGFVPPETEPDALWRDEVRRGAEQVLRATGMMDLRSIVAVRRAFQLLPSRADELPERGEGAQEWDETEEFWRAVERMEGDDEDVGGEAGLARCSVQERPRLRMRRSFELLLTTGNVVRFEAYSCQTTLEWIVRLRPLISYWRRWHHASAHQEMELVHQSTGRARITPLTHVFEDLDRGPEPIPDPDAPIPELSTVFNWCVLEGCRPIVKCGKLFARKGLKGQYKHVQLTLVQGNLIQFRKTGRNSLHHRPDRLINLLDASVISGYLAAQYLPEGEYDPDAPRVARRYQDGLETDDGDEDTLFMLWHRTIKAGGDEIERIHQAAGEGAPPLKMKRKLAVFRTRSKVERDAWVWAINAEIEKVVRATLGREERIREAGNVPGT